MLASPCWAKLPIATPPTGATPARLLRLDDLTLFPLIFYAPRDMITTLGSAAPLSEDHIGMAASRFFDMRQKKRVEFRYHARRPGRGIGGLLLGLASAARRS